MSERGQKPKSSRRANVFCSSLNNGRQGHDFCQPCAHRSSYSFRPPKWVSFLEKLEFLCANDEARRRRNLSRVVAGRFRFLPSCVRTQGYRYRISNGYIHARDSADIGDAACRRVRLRARRRPLGSSPYPINILLYAVLEFAGFDPQLTNATAKLSRH
jgi:hypothetical protein